MISVLNNLNHFMKVLNADILGRLFLFYTKIPSAFYIDLHVCCAVDTSKRGNFCKSQVGSLRGNQGGSSRLGIPLLV